MTEQVRKSRPYASLVRLHRLVVRYRGEARRLRARVRELESDVDALQDGPVLVTRCHCGGWKWSPYQCVTCRRADCDEEGCR